MINSFFVIVYFIYTGLLASLQGKCFYLCSRIFSWNDKEHQQYLSSIASPSGAHQLHIVVPAQSQCTQQERSVHIAKERETRGHADGTRVTNRCNWRAPERSALAARGCGASGGGDGDDDNSLVTHSLSHLFCFF